MRPSRLAVSALGLALSSPAFPPPAAADQLCIGSSGIARVIRVREQCRTSEEDLGSFEALKLLLGAISSQEDGATLRMSGINLQIVSGSGATNGPTNGRGNLIVGYNEELGRRDRGGSHNVVIGPQHGYSGSGGLVSGFANVVSNEAATVVGGFGNEASGVSSTVCGGQFNKAAGLDATVAGGRFNRADGLDTSVHGGACNYAGPGPVPECDPKESGEADLPGASTVSGGRDNAALADFASVSGGRENTASGVASAVSGGRGRSATGENDWRAGSLLEDE
jgi:hypothetical protein